MDAKKLLKNILFIDIETVSVEEKFENLTERWQNLWTYKASFLKNDTNLSASELYEKAGIYSEFGKIICIGLGFFYWNENDEICLKTKIIAQELEAEILSEFKYILETKYKNRGVVLAAHNGKEFDYPYICRRMIVNNVPIPAALQLNGQKPWNIPHYDTMDMWKFGDKKQFTSLDLMAALFDIDSSKKNMAGQQVNQVYYQEQNLEKIAEYCREDIVVLAQVFCKLQGIVLPQTLNIERIK